MFLGFLSVAFIDETFLCLIYLPFRDGELGVIYLFSLMKRRENESNGQYQSPKFKDIQKLIASKLENPKVMKDGSTETGGFKATSRPELPISPIPRVPDSSQRKSPPPCPSLPPPPPPPPLPASRPRARGGAPSQKAPAVVEFYQFLTKQEGKRDRPNLRNASKSFPATPSAHSSIVGEIQNRSAHLLAVSAESPQCFTKLIPFRDFTLFSGLFVLCRLSRTLRQKGSSSTALSKKSLLLLTPTLKTS